MFLIACYYLLVLLEGEDYNGSHVLGPLVIKAQQKASNRVPITISLWLLKPRTIGPRSHGLELSSSVSSV
jgi:hypothetical protein